MKSIIVKIKRKLRNKLVTLFRKTRAYPLLYASYWHAIFFRNRVGLTNTNFYTAIPNPGAGIGHQMANWIAGFLIHDKLNLKFAHAPFSEKDWEIFLGFYENEPSVNSLLLRGYKNVKLPLFSTNKANEVRVQKKIIESYANKKVIFCAEQDQFYFNLYEASNKLQKKFFSATSRKEDNLFISQEEFNVAVHIRRGDISKGNKVRKNHLNNRWLNNSYYQKVLSTLLENLKTRKKVSIYVFSQGQPEDFSEFQEIPNIKLCLNTSAIDSFINMIKCDILITSKSSFSYKPALLSTGVKICPRNFWHGYPQHKDWILTDEMGNYSTERIKKLE